MSNVLEEINDVQKSLGAIKTEIVRLDEKMFRDNILPILLFKENREKLKYIVGITGSPFLGAWITRNGKDAYEMPALFDKRFDKSNLGTIASEGMTEKSLEIEKLGRRSSRQQLQAEKSFFGSINGLFKEGTVLDTREKWIRLFEENNIDVNAYFDMKPTDTVKPTEATEWNDDEDEEL
jgi:hypothetical protein